VLEAVDVGSVGLVRFVHPLGRVHVGPWGPSQQAPRPLGKADFAAPRLRLSWHVSLADLVSRLPRRASYEVLECSTVRLREDWHKDRPHGCVRRRSPPGEQRPGRSAPGTGFCSSRSHFGARFRIPPLEAGQTKAKAGVATSARCRCDRLRAGWTGGPRRK
jgi:hypothetical protein